MVDGGEVIFQYLMRKDKENIAFDIQQQEKERKKKRYPRKQI